MREAVEFASRVGGKAGKGLPALAASSAIRNRHYYRVLPVCRKHSKTERLSSPIQPGQRAGFISTFTSLLRHPTSCEKDTQPGVQGAREQGMGARRGER